MKKHILIDSLVFSSSRNVLLGLSFIRNLFIAKVLGPQDYGYWVIISLVLTYGDQIHFGLRHAGDKEIPYYQGQGDSYEAQRLANGVYGGIVVLSAVSFIVMMIYSLTTVSLPSMLRYGLCITGMMVISDQINRFYLMILRTRKEFVFSSKVELAFELFRTVLVCGFVLIFHFNGALLAFLIASLMTSGYFIARYRTTFVPLFDIAILWRLFSVGIFLFISGLMYILICSLDRIVASAFFDKATLGIYGLAALVMQLPVNSSQGINAVLYPTLSQHHGEGNDFQTLFPLFSKTMLVIAYFVPILVALVLLGGEFLISWLLPAFKDSIPIMRLLAYGTFFLTLSPIPMGTLMASGNNQTFIKVGLITLVAAFATFIILINIIGGVDAIVISINIVFFIFTTLSIGGTLIQFKMKIIQALIEILKIYIPCFYGMILLIVLSKIFSHVEAGVIRQVLFASLMKFGIFCLSFSPLIWILNYRTGILKNLRRATS